MYISKPYLMNNSYLLIKIKVDKIILLITLFLFYAKYTHHITIDLYPMMFACVSKNPSYYI